MTTTNGSSGRSRDSCSHGTDGGFPGVADDVATLLRGWRIRGNEKGRAVAQADPHRGPYTDVELSAILEWANAAVSTGDIGFDLYVYLLTVAMTARRPIQIAALRGIDRTVNTDGAATAQYSIRFPRAKQRGRKFREVFRTLPVIEDLYLTLRAQHQMSVRRVSEALGCNVPPDLAAQIPIFINTRVAAEMNEVATLRETLMGDTPDRLHAPTGQLVYWLNLCESRCTAKSERTGEEIHLLASRFRYTRGTNLRRQGAGAEEIAYALDQSTTQDVSVYTENTVQEAEIINRIIGPKLAPFAQACMGTLVRSEREAIRGDNPTSRVPNHKQEGVGTCGNYGFCASGYRACYTCRHFQPWLYGPHKEVLNELYNEKQRCIDAGCAREVVNANDLLILAVEDCVALCEKTKAATESGAQAGENATEVATHG